MWYQLFQIRLAGFWVWKLLEWHCGCNVSSFLPFSVFEFCFGHCLSAFAFLFLPPASLHLICSILPPTSATGFVFLFWVASFTPPTLFPYASVPRGWKDYANWTTIAFAKNDQRSLSHFETEDFLQLWPQQKCQSAQFVPACELSHFQLCDHMHCSPPASSVHGISPARILEWVAIPSSRGSSRHRDGSLFPALHADSLPLVHGDEAPCSLYLSIKLLEFVFYRFALVRMQDVQKSKSQWGKEITIQCLQLLDTKINSFTLFFVRKGFAFSS